MKRHVQNAIALLCSTIAFAFNVQAADDAPAPPEILATAMKLEGKWRADARLALGEQKHAFVYMLSFRKTAGGSGLVMDEHAEVKDVGVLRGTNLIGFDPHDGRLHWFSVDNFGTTHDHLGELVAPDHLRLIHQSQREGKQFREEIDFIWRAADRIDARLVATLGGEVVETLEGRFKRFAD